MSEKQVEPGDIFKLVTWLDENVYFVVVEVDTARYQKAWRLLQLSDSKNFDKTSWDYESTLTDGTNWIRVG